SFDCAELFSFVAFSFASLLEAELSLLFDSLDDELSPDVFESEFSALLDDELESSVLESSELESEDVEELSSEESLSLLLALLSELLSSEPLAESLLESFSESFLSLDLELSSDFELEDSFSDDESSLLSLPLPHAAKNRKEDKSNIKNFFIKYTPLF